MYVAGDAFNHEWHSSASGANLSCFDCHTKKTSKSSLNTKECTDCHKNLIPEGSQFKLVSYKSRSYTNAMHGLCINCHKESLKNDALLRVNKSNLGQCRACHKYDKIKDIDNKLFEIRQKNKWVVVPANFK